MVMIPACINGKRCENCAPVRNAILSRSKKQPILFHASGVKHIYIVTHLNT